METPEHGSLNHPPFPLLELHRGDWVGEVTLSSWAGHQSCRGPYGARDSIAPSDGDVRLVVHAVDDSQNPSPPTDAQTAAFVGLMVKQERVRDAMLAALFRQYPHWRADWESALTPEEFLLMPPVSAPGEFQDLVGLTVLHVLEVEKNGVAYLGFELGCSWDREHGLGFLVHEERVVDLGGADTAFAGWNARKDSQKGGTT